MRRLLGRVSFLTFIAMAASGAATACYDDAAPLPARHTDVTGQAEQQDVGSLGIDLVVVGDVSVASASYTITGPGSYTKTGTIDASSSSTLSAQIGGIPAATGYSIALSATATDGVTTCTGSQNFDVTAHATTTTIVALDCHEPPKKGTVLLQGVLNVCPVIDSISVMPDPSEVGTGVMLDATAHDFDDGPSPLTYHWTASAGSLSTDSGASTTLTCTNSAPVEVTLTVSDGDPNPSCAASMTGFVTCVPGDAGIF